MTTILALTDSPDDIRRFCPPGDTLLFTTRVLPPGDHGYEHFEAGYRALKASCDLSTVDLVIAEYVESLPLLWFMRRDGYSCPALMIPHTNPYPLHILCYFLLIAEESHPADLVICGSPHACRAYEHLTGIRAEPICTFGISEVYRPADRAACRAELGLPQDATVLLYTGRFMNDKGLDPLLEGYELLRRQDPRVLLALSTTHIDPSYYNRLAPRLRDAVVFHRLEKERTARLYAAADVFVSGATSVFETYAKSALEALACQVPAVVPRWDGFPHYVGDHNGGLVDVVYRDEPHSSPYEFARMDTRHFAEVCRRVLERRPVPTGVADWARYEHTMTVLPGVVERMARAGRSTGPPSPARPIDPERHPASVRNVLRHYGLDRPGDPLRKADRLGLLGQREPGERGLLRALHHDLFGVMDAERQTV
ncbi:glycosyltransferase family 4 protein [Streptomyces yaizuensis]|uniref:Glycosyltransferase family 4 protein n=1 Tax=Streptomyces yaizuensis TaxID=2989713 RepID=A0ABQ5P2R3_9ACTN|nr:glycosyltransferase family 4 protein [Streptomyces sp. YSPA8]GLF96870.1 glycosyltransferase family 4 protein [Streptomyces sp. YSPA8]